MERVVTTGQVVKKKHFINPVYTMEGKEIVLVMATSGGKYELKVFAEPGTGWWKTRPYSIKNFVRRQGQMKQTGASSGYDLPQLLVKLAKTKYFAKSMDKINYIVKYDDIGFEEFYSEALKGAAAKSNPIETTQWGNVDVRPGLSSNLIHVPGKRLTVTCRSLGIECVPALVGWTVSRGRYKPELDGVVIYRKDLKALQAAIAKRDKKRLTPAQKKAQKEKKQKGQMEAFRKRIIARFPSIPAYTATEIAEHATEIGSGRVGRSRTAESPIMGAVVAYVRHYYTEYDYLIQTEGQGEARRQVGHEIAEIIREWEQPKKNPCQSIGRHG